MKHIVVSACLVAAFAIHGSYNTAAALGAVSASEIVAAANDPNNASGLVPEEVEDWIENILSNSSLGPYIRQALNAMESPLIGPYQWNGYLPCAAGEANCGNNLLRYAQRSNISEAACLAYDELALVGFIFNNPPHGSSGCIKPYWPPGVTQYTFIGYERCNGGLFCFAGWRRHDVSPLSYGGCFGMMIASGWRPLPEKSGPQPPLGVCIPEIN